MLDKTAGRQPEFVIVANSNLKQLSYSGNGELPSRWLNESNGCKIVKIKRQFKEKRYQQYAMMVCGKIHLLEVVCRFLYNSVFVPNTGLQRDVLQLECRGFADKWLARNQTCFFTAVVASMFINACQLRATHPASEDVMAMPINFLELF